MAINHLIARDTTPGNWLADDPIIEGACGLHRFLRELSAAALYPPVQGFGWQCSAASFVHRDHRGPGPPRRCGTGDAAAGPDGYHSGDGSLLGLSVVGFAIAGFWHWISGARSANTQAATPPTNPLELGAAAIFAALFVVISLASAWARSQYGATGVYVLAAIVGVSEIDPFVLSPAEHGAGQMPVAVGIVAILIAASSNNLLKAGYAAAFAGFRASAAPVVALGFLAMGGIGIAAWMAGIIL
jgi:hypothetical protein